MHLLVPVKSTAKVSLVNKFAYFHNQRNTWSSTVDPVSVGFEHVEDQNQLEDAIRRAQHVIVNPQVDPVDYVNTHCEDTHFVDFSQNLVHLEVRDVRTS